ncbi:MAG: hypothetical protein WC551_01805 [Patescibacteria group bacterium]
MELSPFVSIHAEKFGAATGKLAMDLAALLDSETLSIKVIEVLGSEASRLALVRLEVFEDLSAVCVQCGIRPPELEIETLLLCRPQAGSEKEAENVKELVSEARRRVGLSGLSGDNMSDLLSLTCCLEMMPGLAGSWDDRFVVFRAALNAQLLKLGKPTIRPDFSGMSVKGAVGRLAAPRELKVVIVDDDVREIVRTTRALAGWPNLTVAPFRFTVAEADCEATPERTEEILRATAQSVIDIRPDIVLMDEGMPVINGGQLILAIVSLKPDFQVEFVGNTGGSGHALREAGAIMNLDKGRDFNPLIQAIRRFGRG